MPTDDSRQGGSVWIDWANECVWRRGAAVRLTPKAWAVRLMLTTRVGQLVPKADLLQAVWPAAVVSEGVLTGCIGELRKALGETARAPQWIQTVHRRGYRFVGPVPGPGSGAWGAHPAVGQPPEAAAPPLDAPASPGASPHAATMVGRVAELAQLHQWLAQARGGVRHVVFVTGEPGIGKTTVVQTFVEQVTAMGGVWIAQGQCLEHGSYWIPGS